jgi:16S rRNA (guanine527-N7)-methyltransferase
LDSRTTTLLRDGCNALGLALDARQQRLLLEYLNLLTKWNQAYNLTAIRDEQQMVIRHLLDSLAIAPYVTGRRIIDVGTGAGLPGVPLAIVLPEQEFHLLDSNGKKTRFLFQVKTALRLDNIAIHQQRVESFPTAQLYDTVLSRAFASLQDMVHGCRPLLAPGGRFLAMKGAYPEQELDLLRADYPDIVVHRIVVPHLDEQRHLVDVPLPGDVRQP